MNADVEKPFANAPTLETFDKLLIYRNTSAPQTYCPRSRQDRAGRRLLASQHPASGRVVTVIKVFLVWDLRWPNFRRIPSFPGAFQKGLAGRVYISLLRLQLFTHERKQKDNIIHMAAGAGIAAP